LMRLVVSWQINNPQIQNSINEVSHSRIDIFTSL